MANKKEEKQAIRKKLLELRCSIPEKVFLQKSAGICSKLKNTKAFKSAHVIHCYISINDRREVNTHPLIKDMLRIGRKVIVPITNMHAATLSHVELEKFEDLKKNKWGVPEPTSRKEVPAENIDLVIVPMVGGDRRKNRIGYGKGFYDRFLQQLDCPKIGLLFEQCLVNAIPAESFDVRLSAIITQNEYIT